MVAGGKQCASRSTITPIKICSANLYRCSRSTTFHQIFSESKLHINYLELEEVPLVLKEFQDLYSDKIVLVATDNTNRRHEVRLTLCPSVENLDLVHQETSNTQSQTHPRPAECGSRQAIQARPDHPNSDPSFQGFSRRYAASDTSLRPIATRFNKLSQFVSPILDPLAWAVDALSLPWDVPDVYAFPPVAILGKVIEKLRDHPCHRIILFAPVWPNMSWFRDLLAMSSQIPLSLPNLLTQPFYQTLYFRMGCYNQAPSMATDQPLLTNWEIHPLTSVRMKTSLSPG